MLSQLAMVTDFMSKLGYTALIFVEPELKLNGTYYCDLLLSQLLLLAIPQIFGEFIFRQDNAPAYRVC